MWFVKQIKIACRVTLFIVVSLGGLMAKAGPCEEVAFSDLNQFYHAMTQGLKLQKGQGTLMQLYLQGTTPHPHKRTNSFSRILEFPEISKPWFREQILEFPTQETPKAPKSLTSFITNFNNSASQIRNRLFNIEANLGYYLQLLGWKGARPALPPDKGFRPTGGQGDSSFKHQGFLNWLETTALNQETRDFIQDPSYSYKDRAKTLFKALEQIRSHLSQEPGDLPLESYKGAQKKLTKAMVELVHTVGFGNPLWIHDLKSPNPTQSFRALQNILGDRDNLALELGFKGQFNELQETLGFKILNETKVLNQIQEDTNQLGHKENRLTPLTPRGVYAPIRGENETQRFRLRALSLHESPFRACFGGDCSTQYYFEKGLDPNFIYFTLTNNQNHSFGYIAVVLGTAHSAKEGKTVPVGFVETIQGIDTHKIKAMLEGIRLSLKERGYILALSKNVGKGNDALSNHKLINNYIEHKILPLLTNPITGWEAKPHSYSFLYQDNRVTDHPQLLEFTGVKPPGVVITAGDINTSKLASLDTHAKTLYKPLLSLKNSTNEKEQLQFLSHLLNLWQIKDLNVSYISIKDHLLFVLNNKAFSFKVRKKAFYVFINLTLIRATKRLANDLDVSTLSKLKSFMTNMFSKAEIKSLKSEMLTWPSTYDYRRTFTLLLTINFWKSNQINSLYDFQQMVEAKPFGFLLNKELIINLLLSKAIDESDVLKLKGLLQQGAEPNFKDPLKKNEAILIMAIRKGHKKIVHSLLSAGANPNTKNLSGQTSLDLAIRRGQKDIVLILLMAGANPNFTDLFNNPALITATESEHTNMIPILLSSGADPNIISAEYGVTALIMAVKKGQTELVNTLLVGGADPNIVGRQRGWTALNWALEENHAQIARLLVKHEAHTQGHLGLNILSHWHKMKDRMRPF